VRLSWDYRNRTDKRIVCIEIAYAVRNTSGAMVFENTAEDAVVLEPFERQANVNCRTWRIPRPHADDPYARLREAARSSGFVNARVLKVVFEDGTVLHGRAPRTVLSQR